MKEQLQRRQALNSRYSLRSFAKKIGLSPSKLSELLSGKKRLSAARAGEVAEKLGLSGKERELFVLSARLESSAKNLNKKELQLRTQSLAKQINAGRTTQQNAWYFGAVKALEDQGIDAKSSCGQLGITELQVENARRFENRIKRFYPERQEYSYESISILNKIAENQYTDTLGGLGAEFLFLTPEQNEILRKKILGLIQVMKLANKNISRDQLCLVHWGTINLIKK